MFCRYCGKSIARDSLFCTYCGKTLGETPLSPEPIQESQTSKQITAHKSSLSELTSYTAHITSKHLSGSSSRLTIIGFIFAFCLIVGVLTQCGSSCNHAPSIFSQNAKNGDNVYVDIVSITPEYCKYRTGGVAASVTDVICRCKSSDGNTVWVIMSIYEYHQYIDPDAEFRSYASSTYETARFSPARRIYGEARKAENINDGLSAKTGTMILSFESIN